MAYKPENDPKLVRLDKFTDLLYAIQYTHTMSLGDICEYLMVKRDWVSTYIKYNVPHIFMQGYCSKKTDWRSIVNSAIKRKDYELVWFEPKEVYSFLNNNILAFTRQSIEISPRIFLKYEQIVNLCYLYTEIVRDTEDMGKRIDRLIENKFYEKVINELPLDVRQLKSYIVSETSRTGIPHVEMDQPELFGKYELKAIRDMIGYSGTDERERRRLFKAGYSKIELNILGKGDKIGKLVFFVDYDNYRISEFDKELEKRLNNEKKIRYKDQIVSFVSYISFLSWTIRYDKYKELLAPKIQDLITIEYFKCGHGL